MSIYKKVTKDDIDFPRYCYFFIKELQESIDEYDVTEVGDELTVDLRTSEYPYCSEALELIKKTFTRKGYLTKMSHYKLEIIGEDRYYNYKWELRKLPNTDDLPF